MRSGVRVKPSRVGSSPKRTISSRARSSKLALVSVLVSTDPGVSGMGVPVVCLLFIVSCLLKSLSSSSDYLRLLIIFVIFELFSQLRFPCEFKRIHHGLFQAYLFQMSQGEATLQNIVDHDAQVLCGRNSFGKLRERIEVLQVKPFNDL